METKKETVIKTKDLTKRFGDFVAVDRITFEVQKGEIFGFLGANGAGKTTAMRMLCGLSRPTSGEALVAGVDVYHKPEEIKRNIGYMSQKFSLYEDLTVLENIKFYAGIYGLSDKDIKEKSDELVEKLGLQSQVKKLVKGLPLGWRQKLAFSVAIVHQPKVVFLDEPTGGVDPSTRKQFWDMIYDASGRGITIFVTTHYLDEAEYCDRICIMVDGKIKALDTPFQLKQNFKVDNITEVFYQLARQRKEPTTKNMKQFFSFIKKEFSHVFRDRKTLLMLFGVPVVQIVLFGFALTNEIKNSNIVIVDNAKDMASQQIITKIASTPYFHIQKALLSSSQIDAAFKSGNIKLAIVFPANFYTDLLHTNKAQIQVIADASDPNTGLTLTNYVTSIVADYQSQLNATVKAPEQINLDTRMLYNPDLKGAPNFVPGVIAMVMLLVCVMMTSISIVREKELGTMEVLLVSPFKPLYVILAKAVPYLVLSLVNLTVILILSVFALDLPIKGSIPLLYGVSTLYIITSLSLGLLVSTGAKTQEGAMTLSLVGMMLPTLMLSGYIYPIENMPMILQVISNVVPAKWFYIIVKAVMLKGLGFSYIWKETLILLGMTIIFLTLS